MKYTVEVFAARVVASRPDPDAGTIGWSLEIEDSDCNLVLVGLTAECASQLVEQLRRQLKAERAKGGGYGQPR